MSTYTTTGSYSLNVTPYLYNIAPTASGSISIRNPMTGSFNFYPVCNVGMFKMKYEGVEYNITFSSQFNFPYYACTWDGGSIVGTFYLGSWTFNEQRTRSFPLS